MVGVERMIHLYSKCKSIPKPAAERMIANAGNIGKESEEYGVVRCSRDRADLHQIRPPFDLKVQQGQLGALNAGIYPKAARGAMRGCPCCSGHRDRNLEMTHSSDRSSLDLPTKCICSMY